MRNAIEDDRWHVYRWVIGVEPDPNEFAVVAADMFLDLRARWRPLPAGRAGAVRAEDFDRGHLIRRRNPGGELPRTRSPG